MAFIKCYVDTHAYYLQSHSLFYPLQLGAVSDDPRSGNPRGGRDADFYRLELPRHAGLRTGAAFLSAEKASA